MARDSDLRVLGPRPQRARSSTASSRRTHRGRGRRQAARAWATPRSRSREANAGHEAGDQAPGFGSKVKLKDLAVMSPAVRDDDQRRPVAAARAVASSPSRPRTRRSPRSSARSAATSRPGQSLSDALAKHPDVFPPLMVNMIRAGEVGGFLDAVLLQIADELRGRGQAARQDQVGDDLPGRRLRHRDPRCHRHAALHRPDLRQDVRRPRRRAAGADPGAGVPVATSLKIVRRRSCIVGGIVGVVVLEPDQAHASGCATSSTR